MLHRRRQLGMRVLQSKDAALFALALHLAHFLRTSWVAEAVGWRRGEVEPFGELVSLYLIIVPAAPLVLGLNGFYNRPPSASRIRTFWILFRACSMATPGVIAAMFLFRIQLARGVIVLFGMVSLGLMLLEDELERLLHRSGVARFQRSSNRSSSTCSGAKRVSSVRAPCRWISSIALTIPLIAAASA